MYAASGNCHVFVDANADLDMARRSSSTPRPSGPASATPPRPCSSTPGPRRRSCRGARELREVGVGLRSTARTKTLAGDGYADATDED